IEFAPVATLPVLLFWTTPPEFDGSGMKPGVTPPPPPSGAPPLTQNGCGVRFASLGPSARIDEWTRGDAGCSVAGDEPSLRTVIAVVVALTSENPFESGSRESGWTGVPLTLMLWATVAVCPAPTFANVRIWKR